jgi:hypothetical protein
LLSKGCGSFGHLASPDPQVNSALDYPFQSYDATEVGPRGQLDAKRPNRCGGVPGQIPRCRETLINLWIRGVQFDLFDLRRVPRRVQRQQQQAAVTVDFAEQRMRREQAPDEG